MPHARRADSSHAFCSHCGYPPAGRWRVRPNVGCARCQLGSIVQTTPGFAPRSDEPFVIVDERLRVQAVSRQAEDVLLVTGADGLGAPLGAFLVPYEDGDPTGAQLASRIGLATAGRPRPGALGLRTAGAPELRFRARISSCGPPAGALVVLTPVDGHEHVSADFARRPAADPEQLGTRVSFLIPSAHRPAMRPGRI